MIPFNMNINSNIVNAKMTGAAGAATQLEGASLVQGAGESKFQNMSVEELLVYCQVQMNSIDDDIRRRMGKQERLNAQKAALGAAKNAMAGYDEPTAADARKAATKLREEAAKLPKDDPVRKSIEKEAAKLEQMCTAYDQYVNFFKAFPQGKTKEDEYKIDETAWKQIQGDMENAESGLDDQSSMRMMKLQSLVSKRQTTIQLITNMISKFNQGPQGIAANMKG